MRYVMLPLFPENFRIEWSPPERYEIVQRVGGGKYSEVRAPTHAGRQFHSIYLFSQLWQVFGGVDMVNNEQCIIKVLKPVAPKKIKREIKILRNLTGGPNVVALLDVVKDPSGRYHSLIMEYVENVEWKFLYSRLVEADIKYYTFQLLKVSSSRCAFGCGMGLSHSSDGQALDFVHSHGVMHRDVKPGNVMVDHARRKVGFSDFAVVRAVLRQCGELAATNRLGSSGILSSGDRLSYSCGLAVLQGAGIARGL